ncbi:hypothetical protein D7V80_03485 [Corallococcus sp. CA054B]|nr:hypothetical protein D7V80_03485 [Corallococcus sp. CA054B]
MATMKELEDRLRLAKANPVKTSLYELLTDVDTETRKASSLLQEAQGMFQEGKFNAIVNFKGVIALCEERLSSLATFKQTVEDVLTQRDRDLGA